MSTPTPARCSVAWHQPDLPAWGTAARADFWLAIEQPGPWGNRAATQSHLDPELGATLDAWCTERGGRLCLIRRPGQHADRGQARHQVLLATDLPGRPQLLGTTVANLHSLPPLLGDWRPNQTAPEQFTSHPGVLLICTNGRRDQCCAIQGRPLAHDLAATHPDQIWEASHTGGHRFAPTGVALPTGQTFARLDAPLGRQILADLDQGQLTLANPDLDRGRSHLPPAAQVMDAWAHQTWREPAPEAISVDPDSGEIWHRDGRRARVEVSRIDTGDQAPESCGKAAVPMSAWRLHVLSTD